MVLVLPKVESFGERFGRAIGQGAGAGMERGLESRRLNDEMEQENQAAEKLGLNLRGFKDPKLREKIVSNFFESQQENAKQKANQEFLSKLFPDNEPIASEQVQEDTRKRPMGILKDDFSGEATPSKASQNAKSTKPKGLIPQEKIYEAALRNPAIADKLQKHNDSIMTQQRHEETLKQKSDLSKEKQEFEERKFLRSETLPLRKQYADSGSAARESIKNKEYLSRIVDSGELDDPTYAAFAEFLPNNFGKRLLSPTTTEYKAALVDEYGDLRNIFQGQTRVKELEILENKLPDIYLTDAQKKAVLKSRINALKADVIRSEVAAELEDEPLGPAQFEKELEKRAAPRLQALFDQILDEQKSIINAAESKKKVPLNPDDPEDLKILEEIMAEAEDDKSEARRIAKEKGYSF